MPIVAIQHFRSFVTWGNPWLSLLGFAVKFFVQNSRSFRTRARIAVQCQSRFDAPRMSGCKNHYIPAVLLSEFRCSLADANWVACPWLRLLLYLVGLCPAWGAVPWKWHRPLQDVWGWRVLMSSGVLKCCELLWISAKISSSMFFSHLDAPRLTWTSSMHHKRERPTTRWLMPQPNWHRSIVCQKYQNASRDGQTRHLVSTEATFVHPDKLGREPTDADRARTTGTLHFFKDWTTSAWLAQLECDNNADDRLYQAQAGLLGFALLSHYCVLYCGHENTYLYSPTDHMCFSLHLQCLQVEEF